MNSNFQQREVLLEDKQAAPPAAAAATAAAEAAAAAAVERHNRDEKSPIIRAKGACTAVRSDRGACTAEGVSATMVGAGTVVGVC